MNRHSLLSNARFRRWEAVRARRQLALKAWQARRARYDLFAWADIDVRPFDAHKSRIPAGLEEARQRVAGHFKAIAAWQGRVDLAIEKNEAVILASREDVAVGRSQCLAAYDAVVAAWSERANHEALESYWHQLAGSSPQSGDSHVLDR